MLKHTFCHCKGISSRYERILWANGLHTWEDVMWADRLPIKDALADSLLDTVRQSVQNLRTRNITFFFQTLPVREHWRLFHTFREDTAYFDIETTGLDHQKDFVSTIVIYDGNQIRHYIHGENIENFGSDIEKYKLLISYNGKSFDVPFIRKHLGVPLKHPHIDLRYILGNLGYRGGLKGCERQLGINRHGFEDVDGTLAVLLWEDYQLHNNKHALETLLGYNTLDVLSLESLMVISFNKKLSHTPFNHLSIPMPDDVTLPFNIDRETIEKLKKRIA